MKMFAIATVMMLSSVSAFANSFPDFGMTATYEKSVIAKNAQVLAYAEQLGASTIKVVDGRKGGFEVRTNNGCVFAAKVSYVKWPSVTRVSIGQAICK